MSNRIHSSLLGAVVVLASCCVYLACSDDNSDAVKETSPDARVPTTSSSGTTSGATSSSGATSGGTSSGDAGPTDCVANPTTYLDIINACTTATRITKNPVLTQVLPDGGLPPLN